MTSQLNKVYSKDLIRQFQHPKNMGELKNPDSVGIMGNPICGDVMKIYLKLEKQNKNPKIKDIKFQTMGCAAAIATSSAITQLAKGKTIKEAKEIKKSDVVDVLGGLPSIKMHCSNLAVDTLKKAIENWENSNNKNL